MDVECIGVGCSTYEVILVKHDHVASKVLQPIASEVHCGRSVVVDLNPFSTWPTAVVVTWPGICHDLIDDDITLDIGWSTCSTATACVGRTWCGVRRWNPIVERVAWIFFETHPT